MSRLNPDHPTPIERRAAELEREFPNAVKPVSVMATDRSGAPPEGTVIETPPGQPNMIVTLMTPLAQVAVRGARTYVQGVVGFLLLALASRPTAEALGVVIPPGDFWQALQVAAGLALAPTVISLLQNAAELLGKLDTLLPKVRA